MSYYTGKNLDRKVKEYGLETVDTILQSVANGTGRWQGDLAITVPHGEDTSLDSLRIVIYSIIHRYGLKDRFKVRMVPVLRQVQIIAAAVGTARHRTYIDIMGQATGPTPVPGSIEEDKYLTEGIWTADVSDVEGAGAGAEEAEAEEKKG